jgi:tripartite-type tricarboxylate transporter receptor subunit TctC
MFLAPAGTPREIVNRLSVEVAKALASQELHDRLVAQGMDIVGSNPAEAGRFLDSEIAKWARVINTAGITAEQ